MVSPGQVLHGWGAGRPVGQRRDRPETTHKVKGELNVILWIIFNKIRWTIVIDNWLVTVVWCIGAVTTSNEPQTNNILMCDNRKHCCIWFYTTFTFLTVLKTSFCRRGCAVESKHRHETSNTKTQSRTPTCYFISQLTFSCERELAPHSTQFWDVGFWHSARSPTSFQHVSITSGKMFGVYKKPTHVNKTRNVWWTAACHGQSVAIAMLAAQSKLVFIVSHKRRRNLDS